jgi:hypothetical protein
LGKHWLYCGYPNSPQFLKKLPESVSLTIAFPPLADWQLSQPVAATSALAFHSGYSDLEPELLRQTVRNLFLLCTEEKEEVVFAFLPDPQFLDLASEMGCRVFAAEPDPQRCQAVLAAWQERF